MALTSTERRRLDELGEELARDNPRLARALTGRWYRLRPRTGGWWRPGGHRPPVLACLGVLLLAAAPALLVAGALLDLQPLMAAGSFALVTGAALGVTGLRRRRPPGAAQT